MSNESLRDYLNKILKSLARCRGCIDGLKLCMTMMPCLPDPGYEEEIYCLNEIVNKMENVGRSSIPVDEISDEIEKLVVEFYTKSDEIKVRYKASLDAYWRRMMRQRGLRREFTNSQTTEV